MPDYGKKIFQRFTGSIAPDPVEVDKFKIDIYSTLDTLKPSAGEVTPSMLTDVNSNVGTFGSATKSSIVTVTAKGLVTAASESTVTPAESSVTFTDITTNDVSTTKHGYAPKGSNLSIPNVVLTGKSLGAGTSVSATISGGVATVTHTTHGYTSGDVVVMTGATSSGSLGDFNQLHIITVTGSDTYTFTTTATGTISTPSELWWFKGTRCLNPTLIKDIDRSAAGLFTFTFLNTQSDIYYGIIYGAVNDDSGAIIVESQSNLPPLTTGFKIRVTTDGGGDLDPSQYFNINLVGII